MTAVRLRRRHLAVLTMCALVVGCGVPTGPGSYEPIPDDQVPNRLADTTTTTTTTTTMTTTSTTMPEAPDSTLAPPTTTPLQTESIEVFFISRSKLRSIEFSLPSPVADTDLILLLEAGPVGPSSNLMTSLVRRGLIIDTTTQGGILTIDLDEEVFDEIADRNQLEAIAQIVLTFLYGLRSVGLAVFTFNGSDENVSIPTANNLFTNEPVSIDDYASMRVVIDVVPDTGDTTPSNGSTEEPTDGSVTTTEPTG